PDFYGADICQGWAGWDRVWRDAAPPEHHGRCRRLTDRRPSKRRAKDQLSTRRRPGCNTTRLGETHPADRVAGSRRLPAVAVSYALASHGRLAPARRLEATCPTQPMGSSRYSRIYSRIAGVI